MSSTRLSVDELVDGQKFGSFNLKLLVWSFLAMFADGFEITSIGLAAPHIVREWGIAPGAMGPMMSASLFGILIGAPLFGFIGDRFGRRFAIICGSIIFGVTTLAVVAAGNITEITMLRFLTGIGMGGIMPNAISLNSELSPRRLRAKLVVLMFLGITLGGTAPGLLAVGLVPEHGWKVLFWVGGLLPLIVSIGLLFSLPESVKYLAIRPGRERELLRTLRRMRPDLSLPDSAEFVRPAVQQSEQTSLAPLFRGGLAPITLLLWFCFATTLMANYFLNSWMPVLFEAKGISPEAAAMTATMYHFGAVAGGLVMSMLLDRWGFLAVAVLLALAGPALLLIGLPGVPTVVLSLLVAFAGFCVLGAQFGSNAGSGLIYPTAFRSKGVGMAFGVGRIGSIIGPLLGAALIAMKLPLPSLLLAIAVPVMLGACAAFFLARFSYLRFGGWALDESRVHAEDVSPAGAAASGVA